MIRSSTIGLILGTVFQAAGFAQDSPPGPIPVGTPAVSMEAVAVNDIPIPGGPTNKVAIAIGDVLTCKFFVRDWSPQGEVLRAFLVQIDKDSYASGEQGVVQPVAFQQNPDKDPNAYMDMNDPEWVHKGVDTVSMPDTASEGYRFLSVVQDSKLAPTSPQNGKKYAAGVVKVTPSPNAKGTFTLGPDPAGSQFITEANEPLQGLEVERLTIEIKPTTRWRKLMASDPPDGAVDARRSSSGKQTAGAWDKVVLRFNSPTTDLSPADITVDDGTSNPPRVKRIAADGTNATLELDRGIRSGGWTTFSHPSSKSTFRVGWFPGDVSGDGKVGSSDIEALVKALNRVEVLPLYRTDVDANGTLGAGDLLALLDLVSAPQPKRTASGNK